MNTIHEMIESTIYELAETELDAVSGGLLDFGNIVAQANSAQQVGLNILTVAAGVAQALSQTNTSNI